MPCPVLFAALMVSVWGTVVLLLVGLGVGEVLHWWHRRRSRGAHHPLGSTARTVDGIQDRLRREAQQSRWRPNRVITIHARPTGTTTATPHAGGEGSGADTVPSRLVRRSAEDP